MGNIPFSCLRHFLDRVTQNSDTSDDNFREKNGKTDEYFKWKTHLDLEYTEYLEYTKSILSTALFLIYLYEN